MELDDVELPLKLELLEPVDVEPPELPPELPEEFDPPGPTIVCCTVIVIVATPLLSDPSDT